MAENLMALFVDNVGNCLVEHFGFEDLTSVAAFFAHAAVGFNPLVKPLLHHRGHSEPVLVFVHLAQLVLQLKLIGF
jgi:hypothetical protein